jgi:hypothetical protein
VGDSPDELTVAVIAVMRERVGRRIEPVQAGFRGAKPQMAATVAEDTLDRMPAETIGVLGVVQVASGAFGRGVEFVHTGIRSHPQKPVVVLRQIPNGVVADAFGIVGVVFVP